MRDVGIVDGEVRTAARPQWTARYVTYATAHGETPESMGARDRARYPGGHMAGYIVWHSERLRAFMAAHPVAVHPSYYIGHYLTAEGHSVFDAWLAVTTAPAASQLDRLAAVREAETECHAEEREA